MEGKRSTEENVVPEKRIRTKQELGPASQRTSAASDTESLHSCEDCNVETVESRNDESTSVSASASASASVSASASSPSTASTWLSLPLPPLPLQPPANVEYEIRGLDIDKMRYYTSDGSSDGDYSYFREDSDFLIPITKDSLDEAELGDTSEEVSTSPTSNSDADPGLPRNDYLDFERCLLCKSDKKNISYPYCATCYTWRRNLFPSRPKRRRRHYRWPRSEINSTADAKGSKVREASSSQNGESKIIVKGNKSASEKDIGKDSVEAKAGSKSNLRQISEDGGDSSGEASKSQLSLDTVDGPSRPSTSNSHWTTDSANSNERENCRVCFSKPENGLFVHANSAHLYGCYMCAQEIWYRNGGCPICRRKVFRVTKLYA